jgi:hypothetical protein
MKRNFPYSAFLMVSLIIQKDMLASLVSNKQQQQQQTARHLRVNNYYLS